MSKPEKEAAQAHIEIWLAAIRDVGSVNLLSLAFMH
jgi:hypothetical protein